MKEINKILNELSEINLDKKGKCMVRGDVQGLAYCQGFESAIQIIGYELYQLEIKENKMKIKIFSDCYLTELEKRVNEFLEGDNYAISDIKYQDGNSCYSVLITYFEID